MKKTSRERIRYLGDLQRLSVREGDTFVLMVSSVLSRETCERIQQQWREEVGDANKLIILSHGMRLGVIGRDDAAKAA